MQTTLGKHVPVALYVLLATHASMPLKHGPEVAPSTLHLIRLQEKLRLQAYPDPASPRAAFRRVTGLDEPSLPGNPWTIGYGESGKHIYEGMHWSQRKAEMALDARVQRLSTKLLVNCPAGLTQEQFDALISFAYNVGSGVFNKDAKLCQLIQKKDVKAISRLFRRWSHANGQEVPGLVTRRLDEIALFNRG